MPDNRSVQSTPMYLRLDGEDAWSTAELHAVDNKASASQHFRTQGHRTQARHSSDETCSDLLLNLSLIHWGTVLGSIVM